MQRSSCWRRTARGVTHLRIDRRAGVADGTMSFYFQTRSALLHGVTSRVAELDVADFTAALNEVRDAAHDKAESLLSQLAEQACGRRSNPSVRVRVRGSNSKWWPPAIRNWVLCFRS